MRSAYVPSSAVALIHFGLGDDGQALTWLERGYGEHDALMPWLAQFPCLRRLVSDPRFDALLRAVGLSR